MKWAIQLLDYPNRGDITWCYGSNIEHKGIDGIFGIPHVFTDINAAHKDRERINNLNEDNKHRAYLIVEYYG